MTDFSQFTQKYALSKTLRFELKPVGRTLENITADKILVKDEEIERAYQTLKPIMDQIHEQFITESLQSERAKEIDFSEYIQSYITEKTGGENMDQKKTLDKIRAEFAICFDITAMKWKENIGKDEKGKDILMEKGYKILTESGILDYIKNHAETLSDEFASQQAIEDAIKLFDKFFTYFTGFNQNRENYYTTKEQKSTAVATRIVHENLPKFCDNILTFKKKHDEYVGVYDSLDKTKQIKDATTNKMIDIYPITGDYFQDFHYKLCLSQAEIEEYNRMIGHYNSLINLYNQQQTEKSKKLPGFKTLYKQIGCGSEKALFFQITHDFGQDTENRKQNIPEAISVQEILQKVDQAGKRYFTKNEEFKNVQTFLEDIENRTDWLGYYWSKAGFNTISSWYFADWQNLAEKFKKSKENPQGIWEKTDKNKEMETGEKVKIPDVISLSKIFAILDQTPDWSKGFFRERILEKKDWTDEKEKIDTEKQKIFDVAKTPSEVIIRLLCLDICREIEAWESEKVAVLTLTKYHSEESKALIKSWMDHTVNIFRMIKYFAVPEGKIKDEPMNAVFSEVLKGILFEPKFENGNDINWYQWYDGLRNYLTKKVGEDEKENKLKLNFENSTLAAGWDINKERDNSCVLLQDGGGKQYLAVMTKGNNTVFQPQIGSRKNISQNPLYIFDGDEIWKKMEYKLLPGPNKMLPKCLIPKSDTKKYGATEEIFEIYNSGAFKKSEAIFDVEKMRKLIDFYKAALTRYEDWQVFDFQFRSTSEYEDISKFYADVEKQGYKLGFGSINKKVLDSLVESGKIYLFEIINQDSNSKKGENHKNNLHTIYWKSIFEEIKNRPKLNGEAEIFYRKAISGEKLKKKIDKAGENIIDGYRFSHEKFLFHVPITLNFCLKDEKVNDTVNTTLVFQPLTFLGIDRGEKHLAYYSLVDETGKILKQGSFNEINGQNYGEKLEKIAGERNEARKNWQKIGTIKEMKEGYISQVVHEIVKLATEHNSLIVLEDLNTGFKRGRQKIEKSIYQKFELALAKKLNFVVDKSAKLGEIGSVTHALQLTPPVTNYGDIENRKQVGIMLYTRANYTSQTDPATGWRRSLYLKYDSKNPLQFLEKFESIDQENGIYIFTVKPDEKTGKVWKITSRVDRYIGGKNMHGDWEQLPFEASKILDEIFVHILGDSLLEQITENNLVKPDMLRKVFEKKTAIEGLVFVINTIMQIRNSGPKKKDTLGNTLSNRDDDFLHSPIVDEETGKQYDSRAYWDSIEGKETIANNLQLPVSGDANGAYNIARKGIIMSEHIRENKDPKDLDLFISDEEWDLWLTDRERWKEMLMTFASRKAMEKYRKMEK